MTTPVRITQVMLAKGFGGAERSFVDLGALRARPSGSSRLP